MGLRPTQGDEKRLLFSNYSLRKRPSPLCHLDRSAAQWRDLRFGGSFLEMFFDRAKRSGGTCGSFPRMFKNHTQCCTYSCPQTNEPDTSVTAYVLQQFQLLAFRDHNGLPPWCPAGRSAEPAFKLYYEIRRAQWGDRGT